MRFIEVRLKMVLAKFFMKNIVLTEYPTHFSEKRKTIKHNNLTTQYQNRKAIVDPTRILGRLLGQFRV